MDERNETAARQDGQMENVVLTTQQKVMAFLKKNVYDLAIVLICVVYMIKSVAEIQKSGNTVIEIIGNGLVTLLFSMSLARLFEAKGLIAGEESTAYKKALTEYEKAKRTAGQRITEMDEWCAEWSKKNHESVIKTKLYPYGLSYEQFTKNEYAADKYTEEQQKALEKLRLLKTRILTTDQLMSGDLDDSQEIDYKKTTKKAYIQRSTKGDLLSKSIVAITFGYFTLSALSGWSWSGIVWAAFQTVLILALSVMKYFNAYNFINDDMRSKLMDKTSKIRQFIEEKGITEQEDEAHEHE